MIGPWQLLALRENETAMDVSSAVCTCDLRIGVLAWLSDWSEMRTCIWLPLPLTVSCFSKIQIGFTFLVPTVCVCVWVCVCLCVCSLRISGSEQQRIRLMSYFLWSG